MSGMDLQKAREIFRAEGYGRFDGVEQLLDRSLVMKARPRVLRHLVAGMLGVPTQQLNKKTFNSWLYRCRTRFGKGPGTDAASVPSDAVRTDGDGRGKGVSGGWMAFQASEPRRSGEDEAAAVRFPDYGDPSQTNQP